MSPSAVSPRIAETEQLHSEGIKKRRRQRERRVNNGADKKVR